VWQRQFNSRDGEWYQQYYKLDDFPHVAILHPSTGRRLFIFPSQLTQASFLDRVFDFFAANSLGEPSPIRPRPPLLTAPTAATASAVSGPAAFTFTSLSDDDADCLDVDDTDDDDDGSENEIKEIPAEASAGASSLPAATTAPAAATSIPAKHKLVLPAEPPKEAPPADIATLRFVLPDGCVSVCVCLLVFLTGSCWALCTYFLAYCFSTY
jgi:hypothetical protein